MSAEAQPKKKYCFGANGALQVKSSAPPTTTVANPQQALTVVSSMEEVVQACTDCGDQFKLVPTTQQSIEVVQSDAYIQKFGQTPPGGPVIDGADVLDGLTALFSQYEIPIGMLNKLRALSQYNLNFIIDDSGSMKTPTELLMTTATPYVRNRSHRFLGAYGDPRYMTRYEEAENRLHIMFDLLAYIPTGPINISYLNNQLVVTLIRQGQTPADFAALAHQEISKIFSADPKYGTPTYTALYKVFYGNPGVLTMHYLFTDGVPSGGPNETVAKVSDLIKNRPNPFYNALTLISCTDVDSECEWMKEIEENGPYTAEMDDFVSERKEVLKDQGPVMPYSYGFWLVCHLVAAINPDDLDAMDENLPMTRYVFSSLIGRELTEQEFLSYWNTHPKARKYNQYYNQFLTDCSQMAKQIVPQYLWK